MDRSCFCSGWNRSWHFYFGFLSIFDVPRQLTGKTKLRVSWRSFRESFYQRVLVAPPMRAYTSFLAAI